MLYGSRKSAWRKGAMLIVASVLVMALAACGAKTTDVATYKGGTVTDKEFNKYLAVFTVMQPSYEQIIEIPQFKEQLLNQYIAYKVLNSQASEETKKAAQKDIDEQMKQYKAALKSNADLKAVIDEKKLKDKDMENYLSLGTTVVAHMNSLVTDDEMKTEIEKNPVDNAIVSVRHILVATTDLSSQEQKELRTAEEALARAKEVKAKLEAGGDWAAIAKEYSDDTGSKESGGLYADKRNGTWVEEFKQAAYKQEIGVIGEPVETEYGYHVILVEKRENTPLDKRTDAQKDEIRSVIANNHMTTFMTDELPKLEIVSKLPKAEEETPASDTPASDAPAGDEAPATDAPTESPAAK